MKKRILLSIALAGVAFIAYFAWSAYAARNGGDAKENAVRNTMETFGSVLKNISLLAPRDIINESMAGNFKNIVSPDLIAQWQKDPLKAPGRLVSSPWPNRIEITSLKRLSNTSYEVTGKVIETASPEIVNGKSAGEYPITAKVENMQGLWEITSFSGYPPPQTPDAIQYINTQYGFAFTLPLTWQGYSIKMDSWEGIPLDSASTSSEEGSLILIRHPQWTAQNPRQDIPIMVFSLVQWDDMQQGKFHVGAAPFNPQMLGSNANYVFALPARYNYSFLTGWQEVEHILTGNPLQSLQLFGELSADQKVLVCGGIPNGSTKEITETTRLFINLPKDVYPDRDNNLQFQTVSGNATAGYISNGGPKGEGLGATPQCWSYYYEFNGQGQIDLTVKSVLSGQPDYLVHFVVGPR